MKCESEGANFYVMRRPKFEIDDFFQFNLLKYRIIRLIYRLCLKKKRFYQLEID